MSTLWKLFVIGWDSFFTFEKWNVLKNKPDTFETEKWMCYRVRWLASFANQSYLKGCSQRTGVIIHAAVGADSHSNSKPENSKEDCPNDFNWKSQSETYFPISTFSRKNSNLRVGFIFTPFSFSIHFLFHLHFNLVISLLALFSTRIATQLIRVVIECYQISCYFAVPL